MQQSHIARGPFHEDAIYLYNQLVKDRMAVVAKGNKQPPVLADRKQIPEVRLGIKAWTGTGFLTASFPHGETTNLQLPQKAVNGDTPNPAG